MPVGGLKLQTVTAGLIATDGNGAGTFAATPAAGPRVAETQDTMVITPQHRQAMAERLAQERAQDAPATGLDSTQRTLLILVAIATFCALGHSVDHVIHKTHSGWPFISQLTPFTFSLMEYPLTIVGAFLTVRRVRGYILFWCVIAAVGLFLISLNHMRPGGPETLLSGWENSSNHVVGAIFEVMLIGTLEALLAIIVVGVRARRRLGHW